MNIKEYQEQTNRTVPDTYKGMENAHSSKQHLLHASLGLSTEVGEINDTIKKCCIYNQPLDTDNILEEIGDLLWYVSLLANQCDLLLEECLEYNITKLRIRYPEKFTEELAAKRLDKV
jgi:NTP pyrophosphatase (non-canonical NTP hydrolase)